MKRWKVIKASTKEVIERIVAPDYTQAYEKMKALGHDRSYLQAEENATSLGDPL